LEEEREIAIRPARNLPLRLSSAQGTIPRTDYLLPSTVTKPFTDQEDPKEIDSRDPKLPFLRTSSKVGFMQSFPFSYPTGAEQALFRNRGRRSGDPLCSTLLARVRVPFRRSWFRPILRCKRESSPRNVPTGESPRGKRGPAIFFSRRESAVLAWYGWIVT
jgi:hypothetical protein